LGELIFGIVLGPTGIDRLQAHNETFTFLADIGFALIMFVVGSQVPVRDGSLRTALRMGVLRAVGVGLLSVLLGLVVAKILGTGHAALYAVLMASSSAALILPIVYSLRLGGRPVLQMLPQVALWLAALATHTHVSIMLAGFSFGLAVAGVGEPRRLAQQLFAVTEGFLGLLFFVWLGASLDPRAQSAPVVHPARGGARSRCGRSPCRDAAHGSAGSGRRIGVGATPCAGGRGDRRIAAAPTGTGRAGCADHRGAGDHRGGQRLRWPGGSCGPGDRSEPAARPTVSDQRRVTGD